MKSGRKARSRSTARSARGFAEYFAKLPIRSGSAVIFRDGNRLLKSAKFYGQDTIIVRTWFEPYMAGSVLVDPEWVAFFAPLGFSGQFRCTGCEARDNRLFLSSGRHGYATIGERRDTIAIGIRRQHLAAELANRGISEDSLADAALDFDPADFKRLRNLFEILTDLDLAPCVEPGTHILEPEREKTFLDVFLAQISLVLATGRSVPLNTQNLAIVRNAERVCQTWFGVGPSLKDMCSGAGVGRTQLWQAFKNIYGESPANYLIHSRLNRAYEAFANADTPPKSVKSVALSLGFENSGRFARLYKACFGELPSAHLSATKSKRVANR